MDETKRFIRYIIPGLAVVPQLLLFIYFYDKSILDFLINKDSNSLGIILTGFFATGILGYLFSSIYYVLYWNLAFKLTKLDYRKIVTDEKNTILFNDYNTTNLTQYEAGSTLGVCWKILCDDRFAELDKTEKTFGNILHSTGTSILIIMTGFIIGSILLFNGNYSIKCSLPWFSAVSILFLIFLSINYCIVAKMLQTLWEQSFNKLRSIEIKNNNKLNEG